MGRIGIDFKALWNVFSSSTAPELGTLPPRTESDRIPGLFIDCKKNWVQLTAKNGLCVYVARQKLTRQVDLSGFGKGLVGTEPLRAKNGRVEAHLDLTNEPLAHLFMLLTMMVSLPDPEKAKRVAPVTEAGKARKAKAASSEVDAKTAPLSKLDAVAATERMARTWGVCKGRMPPVLPSESTIQKCLDAGGTLPDDLIAALAAESAAKEPVVSIEEPAFTEAEVDSDSLVAEINADTQ